MASYIYKHCCLTARHAHLCLRPNLAKVQTLTVRLRSSEVPDQDVFGQLAEEFQENKNKRTSNKQRLRSPTKNKPKHRPNETLVVTDPFLKSAVEEPVLTHEFQVKTDKSSKWKQYFRSPLNQTRGQVEKKDKSYKVEETTEELPFGQLAKEFQNDNASREKRNQYYSPLFDKSRTQPTWKDKFGHMGYQSRSVETDPAHNLQFESSWNSISECCDEMTALVKKGKMSEAFELLDNVCRSDEVRPSAFLYNILIGACGRIGDTKWAFKLYRQMKERGLNPDASTYTSLFNSCANSPCKKEGHRQAIQLYKKMQSVQWIANTTNYHAMLKAFGRCNDLQTTFHIADEMADAGHMLDSRVLESLLSACITDTHTGFHWALQVWKRFRQKRIRPSLHAYHLFLRAMKECGTGSMPLTTEQIYIGAGTTVLPKETEKTVVTTPDVQTPESRLRVVGGVDAFLSNLMDDDLQPDVSTFTNLLLLLPDSTEAETSLLSTMKRYKLKPDTALFNTLIKRRNFRSDYPAALDVLAQMQVEAVVPDLMTFGVLALGCNSKRSSQRLLGDMQAAGFLPNISIFGALIKNACWRQDWPCASELLAQMKEQQIFPDNRLLKLIEKRIAQTKENLVCLEKGEKVPNVMNKFVEPEAVKEFELFLTVYKGWLQVTPVASECYEEKRIVRKNSELRKEINR